MDVDKIVCGCVDWLDSCEPCERANESLSSIKGGEFMECLSDYQLVRKYRFS